MKFLRNPWVTGALALIALAVVFYQVFAPQRSRRPAPVSPASPAAASMPPNAVAPAGNSASPATPLQHSASPALASRGATGGLAEAPGPGMDRTYLESRFAGWINAPQRDPFLLVAPVPAQKILVPTNSPVALWKLTGIWNQAGSRLAVINNKVYGEGDEIQGFRIQRIEGDEVWFNGTNGLERLGLQRHRSAVPPAPPNAPPAK